MKDKAVGLGKRLITHELVKGSSVIFFGTMLASFFAFLFNLFLVRNFSYSEYAEYATIISLFTLFGVPAQSLLPVLVRFNSEFISKKQLGRAGRFYKQTFLSVFLFSLMFFLGFILFLPITKSYFHIPEANYIIIIGAAIALAYLALPNTALLQSMLKFFFLSMTTLLGSLTKLVFGIIFVLLGFKVMGGLWAVWLSFFVPFILMFFPLRGFFKIKENSEHVSWKEILSFGLPSTVALFALSSFTSTDVLLVKHFFPSNTAGLYAGLSLIGKVIFYFTAPITTVMFPLVVKRYEKKENFQNVFYLALLLVLTPSLLITFFYFIFPHLAIFIFLGSKYQSVSQYLGIFGLILVIFSALNVVVNFFLSIKKTEVVYFVAIGALAQAILIMLLHNNFFQIISITLFVLLVLFAILLLYYSKNYAFKKNV